MSDMEFDCPHCSHGLVVDTRGAGMQVNCPECGEPIEIPVPDWLAEEELEAGAPAPAASWAPAPVEGTSGLSVASMVLGILSVLAFCVSPLFALPAVICGHLGRASVRRAGGALRGEGMAVAGMILGYAGLALFVITVAAAVLGSILLPVVARDRAETQRTQCIQNLIQLDAAKQRWAEEHNKIKGDAVDADQIRQFLKEQQMPQCPVGGVYTLNPVGTHVQCSAYNHVPRWPLPAPEPAPAHGP